MLSKRMLAELVFAAMILASHAHAAPDQKNNRGYVVGKGGVARSANLPQAGNANVPTIVPKMTQGATFGERVNASPQQAGSAVATGVVGAAPVSAVKGSSGGGAHGAAYSEPRLATRELEGSSAGRVDECQPANKNANRAASGGSDVATPSVGGSHRHDSAKNCVRNMR